MPFQALLNSSSPQALKEPPYLSIWSLSQGISNSTTKDGINKREVTGDALGQGMHLNNIGSSSAIQAIELPDKIANKI